MVPPFAYSNFPILGIGLGHQYIGRCLGGKVERAANPEHGKIKLIIDKRDFLYHAIGILLNFSSIFKL